MDECKDVVYKTSSVKALDWWAQKRLEQDAYREALATWVKSVVGDFPPPPEGEERHAMSSHARVRGLQFFYGEDTSAIPAGWRKDRSYPMYVPAMSTKAGKAVAQRIHSEIPEKPSGANGSDIGVPSQITVAALDGQSGMRVIFHPAFSKTDDSIYIVYDNMDSLGEKQIATALKKSAEEVPDVKWEFVKLSEWYAVKEAEEENKNKELANA